MCLFPQIVVNHSEDAAFVNNRFRREIVVKIKSKLIKNLNESLSS